MAESRCKLKVCVLCGFGVDAGGLLAPAVSSLFRDDYRTAVGVSTDKLEVDVQGRAVRLMVWQLGGRDPEHLNPMYLQHMHAYVLVVDATRRASLEAAERLDERVVELQGRKPFAVLLCDPRRLVRHGSPARPEECELVERDLERLRERGGLVRVIPAGGAGIRDALAELARRPLDPGG